MPPPIFAETPRFPDDIAYGSSGGPGFKTSIFQGHSALETPVQQWARARGKWDVSYGVRDKEDMDLLRDFFYDMRGRLSAFRFKDWADYEAVDELLGVGDGVEDTFRLIKTYGTVNPYTRRIFKPVVGTVVVKVAGVTKVVNTDYTIDHTTGIIVFEVPDIPALGENVTASYEFDVPCRFDVDELNAAHEGWRTETWSGINIVEKLLEEPT